MEEFTEAQVKRILKWNEQLARPLIIRRLQSDDERSKRFRHFGERISRLASNVRIVPEKEEGLPGLLLGTAWRYRLIPEGAELEPFLDVAALLAQKPGNLKAPDIPSLMAVQWPSQLKIYVTNYCPHCRDLVMQIARLPLFNPMLHITFIDGALFPELAAADKIHSVPTVIGDERFRWTGPVRLEELLGVLAERDPSRLGLETFKRMIQEGDADRLATMMIENNQIFQGFIEALLHPEFQTRLGAMVVFEDIEERRPDLAGTALEPIWERFDRIGGSVRGDMIYLIGKAGGPQWISRLQPFDSSEFSAELRSIVQEALLSLRQKK